MFQDSFEEVFYYFSDIINVFTVVFAYFNTFDKFPKA